MHFILLNIVKFIQGMDISSPYPSSPHFSPPSTRSGIKATAGEGERGGSNSEGWPLRAPCDSHTHCAIAPGVPVSCRCLDDRPPSPCSTGPLQANQLPAESWGAVSAVHPLSNWSRLQRCALVWRPGPELRSMAGPWHWSLKGKSW